MLGRITADDEDGYHRVQCPAAIGKIRCPLRPPSMTLDRDRPEIRLPPSTRPPAAPGRPSPSRPRSTPRPPRNDYPSKAHRRSYARRTGAERGFATTEDPATSNIARGWCRLMGLARSCSPSPACSSPATSASSPPGTPGKRGNARCRAPAENKAPSTQDPHPDRRHHSAAPESVAGIHALNHSTATGHPAAHADRGSMPANHAGHARSDQANTQRTQHRPQATTTPAQCPNVRPKREHRPHQNVKTSERARQDSNLRPAA